MLKLNFRYKTYSNYIVFIFLIFNLSIILNIFNSPELCSNESNEKINLYISKIVCLVSENTKNIQHNQYTFYLFSLLKLIIFLYIFIRNKYLNFWYLLSEIILNLKIFVLIDRINFAFIFIFSLFILILKYSSNKSLKKYANELVYILLFINTLGIYIIYQLINNFSIFRNRWVFNEMIVSYFGSFHRRAALGSILHSLSDTFEILIFNSFVFAILLEILVTILLFRLIRNFKPYYKFLILLVPFGFLFHLKVEEFGRKDSLLLVLFILFLNLIQINNKKLRFVKITLFILFGIFVSLTHESIFFFLPFYFLVNFKYRKVNFKNLNVYGYAIIFLSFISFLMLTVFKNLRISKDNYAGAMFEKYNNEEILNCCIAPIEYLNVGISLYLSEIKGNLNLPFITNWIILFFSVVLICFFISKHFSFSTNSWSLIFFVLPLFIVAQDWGRWINLYFLHFILTEIFLVENMKDEQKDFPKIFKYCILFFMLTVLPTGPQQAIMYGFSLEVFNINYFYESYYDNVFEYGSNLYKD